MEGIDLQVVIAILFVVFSAIQWVTKKLGKGGAQPLERSEEAELGHSLEDIYEEYRKQIIDRQTLGAEEEPEEMTPPPLPVQQEVVPEFIEEAPPVSKYKKPVLSTGEKEALENFNSSNQPIGSTRSSRGKSNAIQSVRALLRSPDSTRQAIILTEVLGEPKSMRKDSLGY